MKYQLNIVLVLLLGVQVAQAQESCFVDQPYVDTYLYTQDDFGQSFLPCATAELYRMDIPVHNLQVGTFDATLSIYEGEGYDGTLLYSETVLIEDEWGGFLIHELSSPIWMQQGQSYTYRVDFNGNYGTMWANFANIYPGGINYWNGTAQPTIDMGFYLHMQVIQSECSIWHGGISESWDEPLNWDPVGIPDSLTCVLVGAGNPFELHIPIKASAKDLTVLPEGSLTLPPSAELSVYHTLDIQGSSELEGDVVMKQAISGGEILGSPIFTRLRLEGFFILTEPVTVLDLLDLESGYLANIGTELILKVDEENDGHVYMPAESIAGALTFQKTRSGIDGEMVGIPFNDLNVEQLIAQNIDQELKGFDQEADPMEAQSIWSAGLSGDSLLHQGDALMMRGSENKIYITGQADNTTVTLLHMNEGQSSHDLRSIGNPFPSIVDIEAIQRSSGVPQATYRWDPEARQYSAQVGDAHVHYASRLLRPLDVILVHLPEEEEVILDYSVAVLSPQALNEDMDPEVLTDHHVRLQIESPSGQDQTLIRFKADATYDWDPSFDAMKIASMDGLVPSFGTISRNGDVLAINSVPEQVHGDEIVLYLDPGVEGSVQISAPMIDGGSCFSTLHLEDRKSNYFHDFLSNGSYSAEVLLADDRDRFVLHFDRQVSSTLPYTSAIGTVVQESGAIPITDSPYSATSSTHYEIAAFSGELVIRPTEDVLEIPKEALITVYSTGGKLVFQRKLMQSMSSFRYQLKVTPGIYQVELVTEAVRERKKVYLE